jgi:chromosome segregation ATPase
MLKANPDWNASRAEAHFSLALLHSSPKTGFRNLDLAGRLLRNLERSYPTFDREIELSSLLTLTEELLETKQDLAEAEQQNAFMKKAVDTSNDQAVAEVSKRELVADSATQALQARISALEMELTTSQDELAKTRAAVADLQEQLLQKEQALKKVTEALVGGG